eukprot:8286081-Ditylum_brightwellii.AAC.1
MEKAPQAPLEHLYDNHNLGGPWCKRKNKTDEEKKKSTQYNQNKEANGKQYDQLKEVFAEFTDRKRLEECHHIFNSQMNEGLNTAAAT